MSEGKVQQLPLLPLRDLIIFPHMMMPLFVGREKSINALEEAMSKQTDIVLAAQKDAKTNNPEPKDIFAIGTVGTIIQLLRLPDGTVKVLVEGKRRVKIKNFVNNDNFFTVAVEALDEDPTNIVEAQALVRSVKGTFETYVKLNKRIPPEILMRVSTIENPGELADIIVAQLNLKLEDKQTVLEIIDPSKRLEHLLNLMTGEIEILEVEKKIRTRVKKQMERSQKEYYLNEQMQAIQKELGEKDDYQAELQDLEIKTKNKKMSQEAKDKVMKEIKKLKMMSPMSAEATVVRNYIDWVLSLPWADYTEEKHDIKNAQRILDDDHWGLEKVKDRILEYLAVLSISKDMKGPILCLAGPPGVGKTSLARSIAESLNRPFARISLGGVRDEAEIRGHRKTYVGAMPGKILQALRKVDKGNPLVLLDEIDKMANDFRGDPAAAMLEVLDPEQNNNFQDHYLELEYDLSKVMFIATANSLHTIPRPLLDRMEIINLEGYIEQEKFHIAKNYLVPKQLENHGLKDYKVTIKDDTIRDVIRYYTREAGVRNLERQFANVARKVAKDIVMNETLENFKAEAKTDKKAVAAKKGAKTAKTSTKKNEGYVVTPQKLVELLGPHKYKFGMIETENEIGLTNGMAWTEVGGDLLAVEVSVVPGKGKFTVTGQLGDVMKESCAAAMSYVRSRGPLFGLDKEYFSNIDVHIHLPEGAVPKDGPSAGIALTTSIVSAIMKVPVKRTVAMTGEVSLRGRVMAIGGLKEKILAAHRGGIKLIICPKENEKDLKDIPKDVMKDLKVILVDHVDQVLINALDIKSPKELFKIQKEREFGIKAQYTGQSVHHH
ncbi:endopeptidase La [Bdellovibrio bacteriovorus]|uniref:Lon protease n=1 Tax=Bdellovibrio bacteriovorus (strain ATCC 15356 / DSM 50701 / NCIMB 9529 / HD100) TaxID=264462 RepID=Q6MH16_BDEBA|nr:endopeptidase La [Bdellovibrio bacteriovorus]BEV70047.1 Lon protease 1 [Bdellovibrio bacteriovorus]CAE81111.1 ATP-dependent protease LA [Bdellovibrio bacteriovorus HD100]